MSRSKTTQLKHLYFVSRFQRNVSPSHWTWTAGGVSPASWARKQAKTGSTRWSSYPPLFINYWNIKSLASSVAFLKLNTTHYVCYCACEDMLFHLTLRALKSVEISAGTLQRSNKDSNGRLVVTGYPTGCTQDAWTLLPPLTSMPMV